MKNKYNLDFNLEHKKLKKFHISVGIDYFLTSNLEATDIE